jgi:hypothetical protein
MVKNAEKALSIFAHILEATLSAYASEPLSLTPFPSFPYIFLFTYRPIGGYTSFQIYEGVLGLYSLK